MLKAYYRSNFRGRQWRSGLMEVHARYLERGHGFERGHKEPGFDATRDSVDVSATSHNWALARDRLHWRLILSPDDADRIDLREHVRKVMAHMAKDLDTGLSWVAIEHSNTDHRHAHILLRGVRQELDRDGKCLTLTMPREYVSRGIREISQQLIEKELGPRTEREYMAARERCIEGLRWSELDRKIERHVTRDGIADYSFAQRCRERTRLQAEQEIERLAFLEGMGLARGLGDNRWQVEPDFRERLLTIQRERDVVKSRARVHARQREQELELA
jgi:type IV secretory pathway VirD2 relaxase